MEVVLTLMKLIRRTLLNDVLKEVSGKFDFEFFGRLKMRGIK